MRGMGLGCLLVWALSCAGCMCPTGRASCDGQCVDLWSDSQNCGACGSACGAGEVCVNEECLCATGHERCTGSHQCEDVAVDPQHCGICGHACPPDAACVAGACVCPDGLSVCGLECRDLTSLANCGGCDVACADGAACEARACECPGVLPGACGGVCVDHASDRLNCGWCDVACATGASCRDGNCVCDRVDQSVCSGRCVALASDRANCGRCGLRCVSGASCVAGECACNGTTTLCSGSCVETATSTSHCGGCGIACAAGQYCGGAHGCRPLLLYGEPTRSVTGALGITHLVGVGVDADGNVTWAGAPDRQPVVFASLTHTGAERWSTFAGTYVYDVGDVCVDPVTGRIGLTYEDSSGVRVLVVSSTGSLLWSRSLAGTGRMKPGDCAFSGEELVVGGTYGGTLDFGDGVPRTGDTYGDAFLATYDADTGSFVRVVRFGSGTTEEPLMLSLAPDGDIVVTGETGGLGATIGATSVTGPFVARFAPDGAVRWARSLDLEHNLLRRVGRPAVDSLGNLYVAGLFQNTRSSTATATFGTVSISVSPSRTAAVMLGLRGDGEPVWVDAVETAYQDIAPSTAVLGDDSVVMGGGYSSTFGVSDLPMGTGAFVIAYESGSGRHRWERVFPTSSSSAYVTDMAYGNDVLAVVGRTDHAIDFGAGSRAAGWGYTWVAMFAP